MMWLFKVNHNIYNENKYMNTINQYKNRFYNLLESTMGDVRPLITEDETVKGTPEFNHIVKNLGFEISGMVEDGGYETTTIKNGNQLFGHNFGNIKIEISPGPSYLTFTEFISKLPNNNLKNGDLYIEGVRDTTKIETIKTIVQNVISGNIDKNLLHKGDDGNFPKFFEFHQNNSLEGYDAFPFSSLLIKLEGGNQISEICTTLVFKSKNPENKVKWIRYYRDYPEVNYTPEDTGSGFFKKEYVLNGNKISFEKDRKSTKGTVRYNSDSLYDLADTDKYVRQGMKGEIVKQIQHKLLKSGQLKNTYKLAADNQKCIDDYTFCHGTFGEKTLAAVKEFQDANDLVIDGFVGPDTAEALRNV